MNTMIKLPDTGTIISARGIDYRLANVGTSLRPGKMIVQCPECKKPGEPKSDRKGRLLSNKSGNGKVVHFAAWRGVAGGPVKLALCCVLHVDKITTAVAEAGKL